MRQLLTKLVLLAMVLVAAPARGAEAFDVYVIAGLTGPGAFVGHGVEISLSAAEHYINANGGIGGRPVHFVIMDDQTNPVAAVQLVTQLVAQHVPAIIGPVGAATCNAVMPILERNAGPVAYCLSNSVRPASGTYMFSAQPSTKDFAAAAFRYLNAKGMRKVALLTTTDAAGQDGETVAVDNLKNAEFKDMQLVADEHFAVTDLSVGGQMARIRTSGAQVIDAWTTGPPFGTVLRGVQEAGWTGIVLTNGANLNQKLIQQYGQFVPHDLLFTGPPYMAVSGLPRPVGRAKDTYLQQMHLVGVDVPDLTQMLGWDPTLIVVDALRHLGTGATPTQVRNYILNLHDFAGVNGIYDFRSGNQRGLGSETSVVVRWLADSAGGGKFVTVSKPGGSPL